MGVVMLYVGYPWGGLSRPHVRRSGQYCVVGEGCSAKETSNFHHSYSQVNNPEEEDSMYTRRLFLLPLPQ